MHAHEASDNTNCPKCLYMAAEQRLLRIAKRQDEVYREVNDISTLLAGARSLVRAAERLSRAA